MIFGIMVHDPLYFEVGILSGPADPPFSKNEWTWINNEGTHRDLRTDKLYFFEEAEGTNHSLTIRNLEHQTEYVVTIEVFNPYGSAEDFQIVFVDTPPGYLSISKKDLHFVIPQSHAGTHLCLHQTSLLSPPRTA